MNEQCWALIGGYDRAAALWKVRLRRHVSGRPVDVEADWQWALNREETKGDLAGFAHTHPPGAGTVPSGRDIRTMQAWCVALGKPLLCLISEGQNLVEPAGYIFEDDLSEGSPTLAFEIVST